MFSSEHQHNRVSLHPALYICRYLGPVGFIQFIILREKPDLCRDESIY